jgi:HPt (histidine-containing phosphotransfer) domain-containing protein
MGTGRTFEQAFEENFMGEADLFIGVVELFSSQYKLNLEKLSTAIEKGDLTGVKEIAHKIKGSVSHFHHDEPVAIAQTLEHQCGSMTKEAMKADFAKLDGLLDALNVELAQLSAKLRSSLAA